jgi:penicillin-binding protein 1C
MKISPPGPKKLLHYALRAVFALLSALFLLTAGLLIFTDPPDPANYPVSPHLYSSEGSLIHARLSQNEEWLIPAPLSEMGPWLPLAAVAAEDQRFYSHPGADPLAALRALWQNATSLRRVSGASTITMQLARMLRPRPRTLWGKYREAVDALSLEARHSKREILEMYLNLAPFGGNIRGAGAASRVWFGKHPRDLSLGESALLTALLRSPSLSRPDRHPERARARRDFLLRALAERGAAGRDEAARAALEPVPARRRALPREAPHLASLAFSGLEAGHWTLLGEGAGGLRAALRARLQAELEAQLRKALGPFPREVTAAGIVVENATGRVLAYSGGARPDGTHPYVDCAGAARSPGSAAKPFVYLAAFSESLITPASMLADAPDGLGGLAPRNFTETFQGPVGAGGALAASLNVPAVRVYRLLGERAAKERLAACGIRTDASRRYGDSLVLGGFEVSLRDLARAYAALARGGRPLELRLAEGGAAAPGAGAPDPAAFLTTESLTDDQRLPAALRGENRPFKTGTSPGHRDAWIVMYSPKYTTALWMGDPTGRGHAGLSGLSALGGAAVGVTRALGDKEAFPRPEKGLRRALVCPLSGEPAGPNCPDAVYSWALARGFRTRPCQLHARRRGRPAERWPSELRSLMEKPGEGASYPARRPELTSPLPGGVFVRSPGSTHVPLRAEGARAPVYWYVDGKFFQREDGSAPMLPLTPGEHEVGFIDADARTGGGRFAVRACGEAGKGAEKLEFR